MSNSPAQLPKFSQIEPSQINAQLDVIISENLQNIETILSQNIDYTWDNLVAPIDTLNDTLANFLVACFSLKFSM